MTVMLIQKKKKIKFYKTQLKHTYLLHGPEPLYIDKTYFIQKEAI